MSENRWLASPARGRAWTRPEDYVEALARKRSFRRARREKVRTEPERPRLLLSTIPFVVLMAFLGVLALAIAIVAFPGAQPEPRERPAQVKEIGVAPAGWLQEAKKDFHR